VVTQNAVQGHNVLASAGVVELFTGLARYDTGLTVSYDWSATDQRLLSLVTDQSDSNCHESFDQASECASLRLDITGLAVGVYPVTVIATVDGTTLSITEDLYLMEEAALSAAQISDEDQDGYPAFKDADPLSAQTMRILSDGSANLLIAGSNARLSMGRVASLHWSKVAFDDVSISLPVDAFQESAAELNVVGSGAVNNLPADQTNATVYNFAIYSDQLPIGSQLPATLHLLDDVPNNAQLKLFSNTGEWLDFSGLNDRIYYAQAGDDGCPSAQSSSYRLAWGPRADGSLASGSQCLLFSLQDGGPHDVDGEVNGSVQMAFVLLDDEAACESCKADSKGGGGVSSIEITFLLFLLFVVATHRIRVASALCKAGLMDDLNKKPDYRLIAAAILLLVAIDAAAFEPISVKITTTADSNPAKAQSDSDIESSSSANFELAALVFEAELSNKSAFVIDSEVNVSQSSVSGLGESEFGGSLAYYRKLSVLGEPVLSFRGTLAYLDSETDIRDSGKVGLGITSNWDPSPFYDYSLGVNFLSRSAETDVFSTQNITGFGNFNYYFSEALTFSTGLGLQTGDIVSTATPTLAVVNAADVIEPDNAFGGHDTQRFAYRLNATSLIFDAGVQYAFISGFALGSTYQYINTSAADPIEYDRHVVSFNLEYAF